jgi:hypothetical protein
LLKDVPYPSNVKPWAIGLTNRIVHSIDKYFDKNEIQENVIGHNFRIVHNMREYVLKGLEQNLKKFTLQPCFTDAKKIEDPIDSHYWKISSHRHIPEYYKMLNSKLMFASFGGYYEYKPVAYAPYGLLDRIKRKPFHWYSKLLSGSNKSIAPAVFVFQYDNFRFWEVLYSRSCPVNLDFDSWNFRMPVNPVEGEHYLGIDRFELNKFAEKTEKLPIGEIQSIGLKGREWVHQNYSPVAQAKRLVQHLGSIEKLKSE